MRELGGIVILVALLAALVGGVCWVLTTADPAAEVASVEAKPMRLVRGRGQVRDNLRIWSEVADFDEGDLERVAVHGAGGRPPRVVLADDRIDAFPRSGAWTSPIVETGFGFVELLPSWNAQTPGDTGIRVDGRVRIGEEWSPWLDFGYWGRVPPPETHESFDHGRVAVDILSLTRPADAYQLRVTFFSHSLGDGSTFPALTRLATVASGPRTETRSEPAVEWSGDHAVPFTAQASAGERIGGDICSATCVTMVSAFHGAQRPLAENALAIYDDEHGIFGNWNRAVARAGELGLAAQLERFDSLDQARARLRDGLPLVISIRYKAGEAPSFVMEKTSGHLIVLRGVTADGDFIVNDPASAERGEAAVYKAAEVSRAWLENADGVGYVIMSAGARELLDGGD